MKAPAAKVLILTALLTAGSICNGEQPGVEERAQQIRDAVTIGMSRADDEAALRNLNTT